MNSRQPTSVKIVNFFEGVRDAFQIVLKHRCLAANFNAEKMRKGFIAEVFSVNSAISFSLR
jgi:hypothetical protein